MADLGIVATFPADVRAFRRRVRAADRVREIAPGVLLTVSGAGLERARSSARTLLDAGAEALLSWGTGAGLVEKVRPGDVLLPRRVRSLSGEAWEADLRWHGRVRWLLPEGTGVHIGPLVGVSERRAELEGKRALAESMEAEAADRTSSGVARAAREGGVPFLALRAVEEPVDCPRPSSVLAAVDETTGVRWVRAALSCTFRPRELPDLLRVATCQRHARNTLRAIGKAGPERLVPPTEGAPRAQGGASRPSPATSGHPPP